MPSSKTEASKVLFSVTPVDDKQALAAIRDALQTYLGLPYLPDLAMTATQFHDVAVSQLQANILHLQYQVMTITSVIQMQNATLAAKDAQIALMQERIDLREFQPTPSPKQGDGDKEAIIDGVLSVKKVEFKEFELHVPEILRKLKRKYKKQSPKD
jgi:hypothetical protein